MQRKLDSSEWSLPPRMRGIGYLISVVPLAGALGCTSLVDDVSAQEFGHYLRLGHSDISWATMSKSAFQGAVSLSGPDRVGRCQIYGHAHGWWRGC